jgi:hypothetical protein
MYEFRPATDRIQRMHQLIRDRVIQTDAERALITTASSKRNEHVVPVIKRARIAYDVCAQGRDHNGPTAVCTSARCYDHSKFMDGLALNIRIHPSALNREDGLAKLRDMTKAYLDFGGMEVQYNEVSSETMRAAQKDPDSYRNLVVRIAGYSAYFIELNTDCQNDIIRRTENAL